MSPTKTKAKDAGKVTIEATGPNGGKHSIAVDVNGSEDLAMTWPGVCSPVRISAETVRKLAVLLERLDRGWVKFNSSQGPVWARLLNGRFHAGSYPGDMYSQSSAPWKDVKAAWAPLLEEQKPKAGKGPEYE